MPADSLATYRAKRDFTKTAEPSGGKSAREAGHFRYLVQKHAATRLHYDFRLELNGVLISWAVTRGPSYDPKDKRLAVHVEDHPLDYGDFEGTIPKGEYGGGTVMLWDEGTWEPLGDPEAGLAKGEIKIVLHGERLKGKWVLIRLRPRKGERSKAENWLLIKERDEYATEETKPIIERALTSVRTGRTMEEIAAGNVEWTKSGARFKRGTDGDDEPAKEGAAAAKKANKSAKADALPGFVQPQLATLADAPPAGDDWLHEIKYDGYRAIAAVGGGKAIVYTRKGLVWTDKFRPIVRPLADLPCRSALLDGEVAVVDKDGQTDFGALQDAMGEGGRGIGYYVFDLLFLDGEDLRRQPLRERKAKLAELLKDQPRSGPLFYSDHVLGGGSEMFKHAVELKLEGIVSKRADAPYISGRTKNWLKIKTALGQEFVIIGWQPSEVAGRPFSSLLLAVREGDRLSYAGRVGSGFGERELSGLWPELDSRATKTPAVDNIPRAILRGSRFVRPELVVEIEFRGWSDDGIVRQAAYKGLRKDKKATEVVAEIPMQVAANATEPSGAEERGGGRRKTAGAKKEKTMGVAAIDTDRDPGTIEVEGVRVTHPDRVLFAGEGVTKRNLIDYYLAASNHILPQIAGRPLSLVRCPDGTAGDCFFQKHASRGFPKAFKPIQIKDKSGSDTYLYIEDVTGLVAAVQMGALELHIWGSHVDTLEKPDRIVFDFDPDEDLDFADVKQAAKEMRDRLAAVDLTSFVMASGGKGLHVVVPLTPHYGWDEVKGFAEAMARILAAEHPDRYLAEMSKARRKGKIFVDYLRNGRGATAIAPFSTRARKGAPVAWPIAWSALGRLENAHPFAVGDGAPALQRQKTDPWQGYFDVDQVLPLERLRQA
jgi:bifunctional non-homologous end joining protein LigD